MKTMFRQWLSIVLCLSLLSNANYIYGMPAPPPPVVEPTDPIDPLLKKSYLELLELAPTLRFTSQQFEQVRKRLKKEEGAKKNELKRQRQDFLLKLPQLVLL